MIRSDYVTIYLDLSVSVFTKPNLRLPYLDNHLLPGIYFPLSVSLYLFVSLSHKYKSFSNQAEIVNEIGFNRHNLT